MPTVVYHNPSTTAPILAGVTGAFAGQAEGAKFNEQQRQFNADLNQKTQQFDADLAFRVDQLKVMQNEGRLSRAQEAALAELEKRHQLQMQANGFVQETQEHDKDVAVRRYDIKTRKQETMAEVQQRRQAATQQYTLEAKKFSDQGRKLDVMDGIISKYGDPTTWNPQTREQARSEYLQAVFGQGQTTGMKDIPQAPEADVKTESGVFDSWTLPGALERQKKSYVAQTGAMAAAEAAGRAGTPQDAMPPLSTKDLYEIGTPPDPLTGMPKLSKTIMVNGTKQMSPLSWYPTDELDAMVADAAVDVAPGFTQDNRDAIYKQTLAEIFLRIDKWDKLDADTRSSLKEYYASGLQHAILGAPTTGEDGAVGE